MFGPVGQELLDGAGCLGLIAGHAREEEVGGTVGATAGSGPNVVDVEWDAGRPGDPPPRSVGVI
ncbi:hypothetical protein GCM10010230_18180 [Streptomyces narbonensis]|nr:hypothetical protein GCM10010230_18180 [Streptomyces narbonensis]